MTLPTEIAKLAQHLLELISEGVSSSEIARRLADPQSVGAKLLARAAERRALAEAYLPGRRDSEAVKVETVSTPRPPPKKRKRK